MIKNILKLKDAQKLSKNEQKSIKGAGQPGCEYGFCSQGTLVNGHMVWGPCQSSPCN